jgi:8-oxo-dGTP pyrophosphatase MutT (NUDIX family)
MSKNYYRHNNEPYTSYGVICYKEEFNNYKIILIQRKNTISYIEFLRGKYDLDNIGYIQELFNLMTNYEKELINTVNDFDKLRELLKMTKKSSTFKVEYEEAKLKFNKLKEVEIIKKLISQSNNIYITPEWELPKGRKQGNELNINSGIREFFEETGLANTDIKIYQNIKPLEEIYTSYNNIRYRHVYYFGKFISDKEIAVDLNNNIQTNEVGDIKWSSFEEALELIRPYHYEKKNIVKKIFQILKQKDIYFKEF